MHSGGATTKLAIAPLTGNVHRLMLPSLQAFSMVHLPSVTLYTQIIMFNTEQF